MHRINPTHYSSLTPSSSTLHHHPPSITRVSARLANGNAQKELSQYPLRRVCPTCHGGSGMIMANEDYWDTEAVLSFMTDAFTVSSAAAPAATTGGSGGSGSGSKSTRKTNLRRGKGQLLPSHTEM
jgi:hypothetical protein